MKLINTLSVLALATTITYGAAAVAAVEQPLLPMAFTLAALQEEEPDL